MIRLDITLQESDFLLHWLADPSHPGSRPAAQLLEKVTAARQLALQEHTCPVCKQYFTQSQNGRTGRYCSNACKQKAYRQRAFDRFRQHYPPPRI